MLLFVKPEIVSAFECVGFRPQSGLSGTLASSRRAVGVGAAGAFNIESASMECVRGRSGRIFAARFD